MSSVSKYIKEYDKDIRGKMKPLDELAEEIATEAHKGQARKNGEPYVNHPGRVAINIKDLNIRDPEYMAAALLHDVLEDTKVTENELKEKGIPKNVIEAVKLVSRNKDENYFEFVMRIKRSNNLIAIAVKLCDLQDNLSDLEEGNMKDKYRLSHYVLYKHYLEQEYRQSSEKATQDFYEDTIHWSDRQ